MTVYFIIEQYLKFHCVGYFDSWEFVFFQDLHFQIIFLLVDANFVQWKEQLVVLTEICLIKYFFRNAFMLKIKIQQ